jgi:hypothetical protein
MALADFTTRFDPRSDDVARYDAAIARRNTAWAHFQAAEMLLRGAETRYAGAELAPFIRNYNGCQQEYEWAERDLVSERFRFHAERRRMEITIEDHGAYVVTADAAD